MRARKTILAATMLAAVGGLAWGGAALAQSSTGGAPAIAKPAIPTTPTRPVAPAAAAPSATSGGSTHGNAMPGSAGVEFKTEAEAKAHCPSDKLVWANLNSKAYHLGDDRLYGKTRKGAYMCQTDADSNGFHKAGMHRAAATAKKPA